MVATTGGVDEAREMAHAIKRPRDGFAAAIVIGIFLAVAGCAPVPPRPYQSSRYVQPSHPTVSHAYEVKVVDSNGVLIPGADVEVKTRAVPDGPENFNQCKASGDGACAITVTASSFTSYTRNYSSRAVFSAKKEGFYSGSTTLFNDFGSSDSKKSQTVSGQVVLYRPDDYLSSALKENRQEAQLAKSAADLVSMLRLESILANADVVLGGIDLSSFKGKKYLQVKINSTTVYNYLKLNKYGIGNRLFDDVVRKVLSPLNDKTPLPRSVFGYDLIVYGHGRSFADEYSRADKIEYRFLMPASTVKKYKEKDISGQQLLDASVILMDDERIDLKLN
ncbi:hypothetical protein WKR98_20030 [Pigmentiphaga sp. YJ18]|uniref:hypothetical protein n=1 Tax=Pigmentiphaga sp. YJ18 TaxID=3134907 RepID=UPI003110F170